SQLSTRSFQSNNLLEWINNIAVILGLAFFACAIITFIFCSWSAKVNNTARLNLCFCLFLAQLLFLIRVECLQGNLYRKEALCSVIAGALHFLFLASFVWMLLEALQLFLLVRSLAQVKVIHKEGLHSAYLLLIGYSIPTVVVGVSAGVFPEGYGSGQ
uniref:G-protein coupled receptors family 2 profile 2 domain-containing protein n=1 Tax=Lepisosteus oculatus TaxID=7918 RepID=W5MUR6_LEPOC